MTLLPLFFIIIEGGLRFFIADANKTIAVVVTGLSVFIFTFASCHPRVVKPGEMHGHISDEGSFYRVSSFLPLEIESDFFKRAKALGNAFEKLEEKPLVTTYCPGFAAFYSNMPVVDGYGLTDATIAHQEYIGPRGRPGHERRPAKEYLKKRNPYLFVREIREYPYLDYLPLTVIEIDGYKEFYPTSYRPDILEKAKSSGKASIKYMDFSRYVRHYADVLVNGRSRQEIAKDLEFLKAFYFDHNTDPVPLARIKQVYSNRPQ